MIKAYSDKNNYDKTFDGFKKPNTILRNVNGVYMDKDYKIIKNPQEYLRKENDDFFIKPTIDTNQGRGVKLLKIKKDKITLDNIEIQFEDIEKYYKKDFVIQERVNQSKKTKEIYPYSLNTVRVMSIRLKNEIKIVQSAIRFGNNYSLVDNFTIGGVSVGIDPDGNLNDFATDNVFNKYYEHPQTKKKFSNITISNYDELEEIVKKMHDKLLYFNLAAWDFALNEKDEWVFIEVNLSAPDINFLQANNGPLFSQEIISDIKKILE